MVQWRKEKCKGGTSILLLRVGTIFFGGGDPIFLLSFTSAIELTWLTVLSFAVLRYALVSGGIIPVET